MKGAVPSIEIILPRRGAAARIFGTTPILIPGRQTQVAREKHNPAAAQPSQQQFPRIRSAP